MVLMTINMLAYSTLDMQNLGSVKIKLS